MRIAVSGTHCSGKSTLIEDFLSVHPDYVHEPEPYEVAEDLSEAPGADELFGQLERSVETLCRYPRGASVIAERSPIDFLAYLLALQDLRRGGRPGDLIAPAVELAAAGMEQVDLLVVLPLGDGIAAPDSEDLALRDAMNDRLLDIVTTDAFDLLRDVRVIEVQGAPHRRLAALEQAIAMAPDRRRPAG